jgi:hypothetical protein
MAVRRIGAKDSTELFEDTLDQTTQAWRAKTLNLQQFTLRKVALCIATEEVGAPIDTPTEGIALWQQPLVEVYNPVANVITEDDLSPGELTPEELDARKKHLEALGYIN